jgi:hypothetical protein
MLGVQVKKIILHYNKYNNNIFSGSGVGNLEYCTDIVESKTFSKLLS